MTIYVALFYNKCKKRTGGPYCAGAKRRTSTQNSARIRAFIPAARVRPHLTADDRGQGKYQQEQPLPLLQKQGGAVLRADRQRCRRPEAHDPALPQHAV